MPLFHHRSEEEKAAERLRAEEEKAAEVRRAEAAEQAELDAQESRRRIEAGGLPVAAEKRLRELASSEGKPELFTSDLSVHEFVLLAGYGVQALTQVMGSSIYNVGWQPVYYNVPTEVTVLSGAFNTCRSLAFKRLIEEAQLAGADAVVGVRIIQGAHDWAARAIEFVVVGTAVRLPPHMHHPKGVTVLTDLSGQEFVQLCKAGVRPVGIRLGQPGASGLHPRRLRSAREGRRLSRLPGTAARCRRTRRGPARRARAHPLRQTQHGRLRGPRGDLPRDGYGDP